jgi:membrane fusion protein (multidrug efflux system)
VRVELEIAGAADPRIRLHHGMTATVEVEVARVSPIALLLRAIGEWRAEPEDEGRHAKEFAAEAEAR